MLDDIRNDMITLGICQYIPLEEVLEDNVTIATKNYSLCQVIKLEGMDYQGLSGQELDRLHTLRSRFFADETMAGKVSLSFHIRRREISLLADDMEFANLHAAKVAEKFYYGFGKSFTTEIFMVVTLGVGNSIKNIFGIESDNMVKETAWLQERVVKLALIVDRIQKLLEDYNPSVLRHDNSKKSPLLQFWMYVINGGRFRNAPICSNNLSAAITFGDVEFYPRQKYLKFVSADVKTSDRYAAFLALASYPQETSDNMLDALLHMNGDISIFQAFIPNNIEKTKENIRRKLKRLATFQGFTGAIAEDLAQAAEFVESGDLNFHGHIFVVCVYADNKEELERQVNEVEKRLAHLGVGVIREGWNLHGCFFGQYPDGERFLMARKVDISPDNLAQFISFAGTSDGYSKSAFGNVPVAYFKRPDLGIYNLNWHPGPGSDESGHTFICARPGSGKTTLVTFLIMMGLRLMGPDNKKPMKNLILDSGKGAKIPTMVFGGSYHTVKEDRDISLNPMKLADTPANRDFLQRFMAMLAGGGLGDAHKNIIAEIVRQNYMLDYQDRCFHNLRDFFSPELYGLLRQWLPDEDNQDSSDHANGMIFNGREDSLQFTRQIVGFDMSAALQDKELIAPLAAYFFHSFFAAIDQDPCPHLIFVDEAAQYLEHPVFGDYVIKILRERRKKNGILVMAAQEPSVLTGSKNGRLALQNIETFILWPNPSANVSEYVDGFSLNDREMHWIKHNSAPWQVMVKRKRGGSVVLDVNLQGLGNYLNLFHSGARQVRIFEQIVAKADLHNGVDENLLEEYLRGVSDMSIFKGSIAA